MFFWKFLLAESTGYDLCNVMMDKQEEMVTTFNRVRLSYQNLVPELSNTIYNILQNLAVQIPQLRERVNKSIF